MFQDLEVQRSSLRECSTLTDLSCLVLESDQLQVVCSIEMGILGTSPYPVVVNPDDILKELKKKYPEIEI